MTNRFRNQSLIMVLLIVFLTVSTGAQVHAARRTLTKSGVSTQTAPKPTAGPYVGEPDGTQNGPLPPKDGTYPTRDGGNGPNMGWLQALRALIMGLFSFNRP